MQADPSDDALMNRLRKGDLQALDPLYRRYRATVSSVVQQCSGRIGSSEVEDVCQETFLTLASTAERYRSAGTLKGWLCGIAVRKARRLRDRSWLRSGLLDRLFRRDAVATPALTADRRIDAEKLLALLPEAQREVVVLSHVHNLSAEDVAAALGISPNTVWTRLHRARERMRELTAEEPAP